MAAQSARERQFVFPVSEFRHQRLVNSAKAAVSTRKVCATAPCGTPSQSICQADPQAAENSLRNDEQKCGDAEPVPSICADL